MIDKEMMAHQKELENLMNQIREKRSELRDLSRQRVEEMDERIPVLEGKIRALQTEVIRLDKAIADKQFAYETEYSSCAAQFKIKEEALEKEMAAKIKAVNADIAHNAKLVQENTEVSRQLKNKERELAAITKSLEDSRVQFAAERSAFDAAAASVTKRAQEALDANNKNREEIKEEAFRIEALKQEALKIEAALAAKQHEVDNILAMSREFEERERKWKKRENALSAKEDELNQLKVSLVAQKQKNLQMEEALNVRSQALDVREHNIKAAEATLAGKV